MATLAMFASSLVPRCSMKSTVSLGNGDFFGERCPRLTTVLPVKQKEVGPILAAWTRRTRGPLDPPRKKKSFKQRTEKYMKPFILDVFISSKYVNAKVMHRVTSKVMSVATTSAKELRFSLPSLCDENACKVVGKLLAERSKEVDVYAVQFDLRKNEKFEGKLALVVNTIVENGVSLV